MIRGNLAAWRTSHLFQAISKGDTFKSARERILKSKNALKAFGLSIID